MSFNEIQNHIIEWNFDIILIYKTALYLAVEKENIEIVKLLLMNEKLDINLGYILFNFLYNLKSRQSIKFKIISLNSIQNHIFQWNSKSYLSMSFKIISFNFIQNLSFNLIQNYIFQYHSKSYLSFNSKLYHSMKFKIISFNEIQI